MTTQKIALTIALATLTADSYSNPNYNGSESIRENIPGDELRETLAHMLAQLEKRSGGSEAESIRRKEKTAAKRAELVAQVMPIVRDALERFPAGATANELFKNCMADLPEDFTAAKVGYLLRNEMSHLVTAVERGSKSKLYVLNVQ